ncbi:MULTISPECIES: hypothetical protein [unclassified Achromobacter]|uniref:hypothetical protein n=1 Tax=unclassified Achromobacter TaxID=2626865 RepID=UPI000B51CF4B|nr:MULTISPECIES: hypothetical protein [unclassified Achromobacter]OWT77391.1 hypothetical protein CEY04_15690 [Achromobacter sp. HZ28]OWT78272.1 hypothetical protein CEY05_10185 [Achromobacter sp. HZ34]
MKTITVEALFGKLTAQTSLISSLIRVLPLDALRTLEAELMREAQKAKVYLVGQAVSAEVLENHDQQTAANLALVREVCTQKEYQRPSDNGGG